MPVAPVLPVSPVAPVLPCAPVAPAEPAGPGVTTTGAGGFTVTGLSQAASVNDAARAVVIAEVRARYFMVFP